MGTCKSCSRRSAEPQSETIRGAPLYDCRLLNRTARIEVLGAHAPWIAVRGDFGCCMWKQRK